MVRDSHYKLIRPAGGSERLFDLESDPGENTDIATQDSQAAEPLRKALDQWQSNLKEYSFESAEYSVDEATRKNLASLGYM